MPEAERNVQRAVDVAFTGTVGVVEDDAAIGSHEGVGNAQATAIAPFFVLTAKHLSASTTFILDGSNYTLKTVYDDPHSLTDAGN
jgi:hypothetical protein